MQPLSASRLPNDASGGHRHLLGGRHRTRGAQLWGPTTPGARKILGAKEWPIRLVSLSLQLAKGHHLSWASQPPLERVVILVVVTIHFPLSALIW